MKEPQRRPKTIAAMSNAAALQPTSEGGSDEFAELLGVLSTKMKRKQGDMQKRIEVTFNQKLDELNAQSTDLFTQIQQESQQKLEEMQTRCHQHLSRQHEQIQQLRQVFLDYQAFAVQLSKSFGASKEELEVQMEDGKRFRHQADESNETQTNLLRQQLSQAMHQQLYGLNGSSVSANTAQVDIKSLLGHLKSKLPAGINLEALESLLAE